MRRWSERRLASRLGSGSTRAALIYQHAAQEQDRGIAHALSSHITRERDRACNGPRTPKQSKAIDKSPSRIWRLTKAFSVERVTGIEPALSAWETHKIGSECGVTPVRRALKWPGLAPGDTTLWPVDGPAGPLIRSLSKALSPTSARHPPLLHRRSPQQRVRRRQ
jgi:hypothetical protein